MKKSILFFLCAFLSLSNNILSIQLSDYVAQALGEDETSDDIKNKALFLTKALQVNNQPDAKRAYFFLLKSRYFKNDKTALEEALAKIPMASAINVEQYKGHQGPQAVDDMINMFTAGPGNAVYRKLAPTRNKEAIETVITALENTKSMLS